MAQNSDKAVRFFSGETVRSAIDRFSNIFEECFGGLSIIEVLGGLRELEMSVMRV